MVNEQGLVCCNKSILHTSKHIKRKEKIESFLHACMIVLQKSHNIFMEKNKKLLAFLLFVYSGCPCDTSGDFLANGQPYVTFSNCYSISHTSHSSQLLQVPDSAFCIMKFLPFASDTKSMLPSVKPAAISLSMTRLIPLFFISTS